MKKYSTCSIVYAILALVFGIFYREFTKLNDFHGTTSLSVIHTHYFMLGMFFFLILLLLEKQFELSKHVALGKWIAVYQIGLNITVLAFLVRGITQVWNTNLSSTMDASISGLAGLGHICLGVGLLVILFRIKKVVVREKSE